MRKFFYILFAAATITSPLHAENINLTADEKVEWHQKENKMIAVGNAVASKKDLSIRADKMTGHYDKSNGKSQIDNVYAEGNVIMKSAKAKAYGDSLDYDLPKDIAVLKGKPAKIKTEKETITATESITYYPSEQKAIALGDVVIFNDESKVFSHKLISYFTKSSTGSLDIDKVDISDKVKITNKQAVVTANKGTYYPKTGIVKLFDNVVISQDGNILKGDVAESNLNTGVSKLISNKKGGRVSGVFKEKEKEKKHDNNSVSK